MERKQFTFYAEYYFALKDLPKKEKAEVIHAICDYSLNRVDSSANLSARGNAVFERLRPIMDTEIRQSLEGRRCAEYKAWRKSVYDRDDYTCQFCGARGVKLNAHHRKAYAVHPDLRYQVENGITLCVPCHKKIHGRRKDE